MNKRVIGGAGAFGAAALAGALLFGVSGGHEVQDWKTGEWSVLAGGYNIELDLDRKRASVDDTTVPIQTQFNGDILQVRVPGVRGGLLQLEHAEGRLVGNITAQGQTRPAAGQREVIHVVQTVEQGDCQFAQYTDGSWGVAPQSSTCHTALNDHVGGMRYVARDYTP